MAQGKYIKSADLITKLGKPLFLAIYDDDESGDVSLVNDTAVQQDIDMAEGEVDSYLITIRDLPLPTVINTGTTSPTVDRIIYLSALEFAQSFGFLRHPEYPKTFGDNKKAQGVWNIASARMDRLRRGIQETPDIDQQNGKPSIIGGIVFDQGPRTCIPSPDGTDNGAGF